MEMLRLISMGGDVATMGVLGFLVMHHMEIKAMRRDIERLEAGQ
tara:strand:- start:366 stop:497 length:132 start_codon:yes stop_codon:yes gene_type:complete